MSTSFIKNILLCSFITLLSTSVQADVVDKIEKTFAVNDNTSFRLSNINGSVAIRSWENSTIKVIATVAADNQVDRDNMVIDMQQSGVEVSVETRYKEHESWRQNSHSGKVEYIVIVPINTNLSAINLVNGSLTIDNVKGAVHAELVNGSMKATGLASNSEVSSVNGSIEISYSELTTPLDSIVVETVNGSIKLSVPKLLQAKVEAETMHGSIKTDFGLSATKSFFGGHNLSGEIGHGEVDITMKSVNGSVKLLSH
tara:strand:- start:71 stop:838 length:768 start_codon:yes stop_codon:yes gene_type:complete